MQIKFDDSLVTGHELIDQQHRELLRRADVLVNSQRAAMESQSFFETLDFLRTYMVFHFSREEELMREIGYDHLADHMRNHDDFRNAIEEIHLRVKNDGLSRAELKQVHVLVAEKFVHHIKTVDRRLALFLTQWSKKNKKPLHSSGPKSTAKE